jgi:hypothetical protein
MSEAEVPLAASSSESASVVSPSTAGSEMDDELDLGRRGLALRWEPSSEERSSSEETAGGGGGGNGMVAVAEVAVQTGERVGAVVGEQDSEVDVGGGR